MLLALSKPMMGSLLGTRALAAARGLASAAAPEPARRAPAPEPFSDSDEDDLPRALVGEIIKTKEDPMLWVGQDSMVLDAIRKMSDENAAALLVFDPARIAAQDALPHSFSACVGIVTERDYLRKVVLAGRSSFTTPVKAIMTPQAELHVLTPHDTVLRAMQLMTRHDIRNLPVVDDKAMVGVLGIKDVIQAILGDQKAEIHTLKEFISGTTHNGLA